MLFRRSRLNGADDHANRLFSLFAQNRRHRHAQFVDHPDEDATHGSLKLDWNAFRSDLCSDPAHISTWQRLSQQLTKHHRSKFVSTSRLLVDSKFKRSFNVAMSLTVRALTINGVSPAIIAMTQTSLCQQQVQHIKHESKGHQIDSSVTESVPSSKQIRRDSGLPIRSSSIRIRRSASISALPQKLQRARDHPLAKPPPPPFMLSSKHFRRDTVAPLLHTKSLPTFPNVKGY